MTKSPKFLNLVAVYSECTLNKYKAQLVAKGYHQHYGVDFEETFSPVVKPITIKTIITVALASSWQIHQLDDNNTFLNGYLQEEVFMQQPLGV